MSTTDHLVQLDPLALYTRDNVRQDPGDLTELANSISVFGLLEPPTVEVWSPPADHPTRSMQDGTPDRYTHRVVYGHRRVLASIRAGLPTIPCFVRQLDHDPETKERTAAQLVENIHRENLGLGETAEGVRDLYDAHGSVAFVAEMLGKGAPWVSKMLALTSDGKGRVARELIADDVLTDLDMAYTLTKIEERAGFGEAKALAAGVREGTQNRATLRKVLSDLEENVPPETPKAKPIKLTVSVLELALIEHGLQTLTTLSPKDGKALDDLMARIKLIVA